jgi:hypothetical protein
MGFANLLIQSATVERMNSTEDSLGGQGNTYTALPGTIKCRIQLANYSEQLMSQSRGTMSTHKAWLNPDADVKYGDQLIVGTDTYRVLFVDDMLDASTTHHKMAYLEQRNPPRAS